MKSATTTATAAIFLLIMITTAATTTTTFNRLLSFYEENLHLITNDPVAKSLRSCNIGCVREKLNVQKNGDKSVTEDAAVMTAISTCVKCTEGVDKVLKTLVDDMIGESNAGDIDCYRRQLEMLEESPSIFENPTQMAEFENSILKGCEKSNVIQSFNEIVASGEQRFGEKFEDFFCGEFQKIYFYI
jgi:hypothetical protein